MIDDRRLERDILTAALENAMPGSRVDAVSDVDAGVEYLQRRPSTDIVLMDSSLLRDDGLRSVRAVARAARRTPLVLLSAQFEPEIATTLDDAGAHSALSSNIGILDLVDRLVRIAAGERFFDVVQDGDRRQKLRRQFDLTDREFEVIQLIADGSRNADIAAWLGISESTVRVHVSKVVRKLGVDTRMQAYDRWHKAVAAIQPIVIR